MDIRKWLAETIDAEVPEKPLQASAYNRFSHSERPKPISKYRSEESRSKPDSSIIDAQSPLSKPPRRKQNDAVEDNAENTGCSEASQSTHTDSADGESLSQSYARRPRRKTRPDRYEPSTKRGKARVKYVHRSRKDESKRASRKSKHKKSEKVGSGRAKTNHAKNVTKDRLTIRPREQLGLFNKGKTSTAVKGRGLPDLVFSEMKFLQKSEDRLDPEPEPHQSALKKKRKKSYTQDKEGEISTYFTSVRPALAEKNGNVQGRHNKSGSSRCARTSYRMIGELSEANALMPAIEVNEHARHPRSDAGRPFQDSTSYVSWSESIRAPSPPSKRLRIQSVDTGDHQMRTDRYKNAETDREENAGSRCSQSSPVPILQKGTGELFMVSSTQPSDRKSSRPQSCPQHKSSTRYLRLVDRVEEIGSVHTATAPTCMPAAVDGVSGEPCHVQFHRKALGSGTSPRRVTRHFSTHQEIANNPEDEVGLVGTQISSDFETVLKQCKRTFTEIRLETRRNQRDDELVNLNDDGEERLQSQRKHHDPIDRVPVDGVPTMKQLSIVPNFSGRSFYEEQTRRDQHNKLFTHDSFEAEYGYEAPEPEDFLIGDEHHLAQFVDQLSDMQDWRGGEDDLEEVDMPEGQVQQIASGNSVVASGFWRPNKLY